LSVQLSTQRRYAIQRSHKYFIEKFWELILVSEEADDHRFFSYQNSFSLLPTEALQVSSIFLLSSLITCLLARKAIKKPAHFPRLED